MFAILQKDAEQLPNLTQMRMRLPQIVLFATSVCTSRDFRQNFDEFPRRQKYAKKHAYRRMSQNQLQTQNQLRKQCMDSQ